MGGWVIGMSTREVCFGLLQVLCAKSNKQSAKLTNHAAEVRVPQYVSLFIDTRSNKIEHKFSLHEL